MKEFIWWAKQNVENHLRWATASYFVIKYDSFVNTIFETQFTSFFLHGTHSVSNLASFRCAAHSNECASYI